MPFNALCVVNREVAKRPLDVYRFLTRELGAWPVQFTPCVEARDFKQVSPEQRKQQEAPSLAHRPPGRAIPSRLSPTGR